MSERKLLLPVSEARHYTIYKEKGPVDFVDYTFDDGSKVLTAITHINEDSFLPLRQRIQAVVLPDNYYVLPEQFKANPETERLLAIAEAVTELIIAQAEYEPEAKVEAEATTAQLLQELALVQ